MAGSRCIWRPIHVLWVSADLKCIRDCSYQRHSAVWPATDGGDYFPADQAFGQPAGAVPVPDWNTIWLAFWHPARTQYSACGTPDVCCRL